MNRNHFAAAFLAGVIAIAGLTSTTVAQRKPGAGTALVDLSMPAVAISPDGKQVALILRAGEKTQLHIRLTGAQEEALQRVEAERAELVQASSLLTHDTSPKGGRLKSGAERINAGLPNPCRT